MRKTVQQQQQPAAQQRFSEFVVQGGSGPGGTDHKFQSHDLKLNQSVARSSARSQNLIPHCWLPPRSGSILHSLPNAKLSSVPEGGVEPVGSKRETRRRNMQREKKEYNGDVFPRSGAFWGVGRKGSRGQARQPVVGQLSSSEQCRQCSVRLALVSYISTSFQRRRFNGL